jgi:hypothetical protein
MHRWAGFTAELMNKTLQIVVNQSFWRLPLTMPRLGRQLWRNRE